MPMNDAGHGGRRLNLLIEMRGNFPQLPRIHAGQPTRAPHAIQSYQLVARMPRMPANGERPLWVRSGDLRRGVRQ